MPTCRRCSGFQPVGVPSRATPNTITPPPELARAATSLASSIQIPGVAGFSSRHRATRVDGRVARSAAAT